MNPSEPADDRPAEPAEPDARQHRNADAAHDAEERRTERQMWWYLGYFLFGIHLVALIMIFAVLHHG